MERDFKGVWIPKEIWLDSRLNALDKVILTEIDSLDQGESGCYASNKYIADFCQCSERKVSDAITKLIKLGYIKLTSFDGRLRVLQSCLAKSASLPRKICEADTQNLRGYTIENNIDINIDDKDAAKPQKHKHGEFKHVLLTDSEYQKLIEDFGESVTATYIRKVDEYCEQSGKRYKNYNLAIRNTFMARDGVKRKEETPYAGIDADCCW